MTHKDIELRDWYAGLAMQALIRVYDGADNGEVIALDAFEMAQFMMDRRDEENEL